MSLWPRIAEILAPTEADRGFAERLLGELRSDGLVADTQSALARAPDAALALFYAILSGERSSQSPVREERDPSWALRADFCYLNARASGVGARRGTFLQAAKILPALGARAVHLAPFHPCHFEVIYAIESPSMVDRRLGDPRLAASGIGAREQLRAFVEAAHLLRMAVGYDLVPHLAQYARTVLERPELFRWIDLAEDRRGLEAGLDPESIGSRATRIELASRVRALVGEVKRRAGVDNLEADPDDAAEAERIERAYYAAIRGLIERGLWTVLSHAWNGVGLPEFHRYDRDGNYPVFRYRSESGEDVGEAAYSVVTPYAFHDGLPPNRRPDPTRAPERNDDAVEYFARVFDCWRDGFGFDFVRIDSVDHVLDSTLDDAGRFPVSDRPTPEVLRSVNARIRANGRSPSIAVIAERLGQEFEAYAGMGFDLTLGSDMLRRVDRPLLEDSFALADRLAAVPAQGRKASVCFALDTHDTGSPRLWGQSLTALMGRERLALRRFIARFASCGAGRRPLYETMGFRDRSAGLYEATIAALNLEWRDDADFTALCARVDRLRERFGSFLEGAWMAERMAADGLAWWFLRGRDPGRFLVAVASLETADGRDLDRIAIPLGGDPLVQHEGRVWDFTDPDGAALCVRGELRVEGLRFLEFRLYELRQAFY
ncbi:MAG: hypothetical protein JXA15_03500 [Spirochaetales bacterium]|nr:hypothetical protein [Spirochaetales bacterium]